MNRRDLLKYSVSLAALGQSGSVAWAKAARPPILVVVELSGGNDGLNTVVPIRNDDYYRARPTLGIKPEDCLAMDADYGLNPGVLGLQKLWQRGQLAVVHGCGYAQPSYSHFTSMAYWHTGVPHRGDEFGWLGRVADELSASRRDNMLINVGSRQSLAVKSKFHTPVVFDDPNRFQRSTFMAKPLAPKADREGESGNRAFLSNVAVSAAQSSQQIRAAWCNYTTDVDYGIAPMDLPKVAACIDAGLPTQLYHVSFRNNSFDTHVNQPALHRRLLSYASDGIYGFIRDLEARGHADRVVMMIYSEFGRRVAENANLGTDHGSANTMFLVGAGIKGGHYGQPPSLTDLLPEDNLRHTVDFRQVYATMVKNWLKVDAQKVLKGSYATLPVFA